jgi:HK97 family phage portal protein
MTNPLRALFERRMDSSDLLRQIARGSLSASGVSVTEDSALRITTVETCVSIISRTIAGLPLNVYERVDERNTRRVPQHWLSRLLARPNAWQTRFNFVQTMQLYLSLHRNAYAWINWVVNPETHTPQAVELIPLHPRSITVEQRDEFMAPTYQLNGRSGRQTPMPAREILHIKGLSTNGYQGRALIADCRDALGLAQIQQEHASSFWARGGRPDVLLKHPKVLSDKARKSLEESWEATYGGGQHQRRVAVIEEGMDASFPNVSNEAGQFLETKQSTRAELAAMFHVPGFMAGLEDKQTSWGTGVEQMTIGFTKFAIQPDCENWEEEIGRALLGDDDGRFVKFSLGGLLRGDSAARAAFYKTMREIGAYSANDVRAFEDLNPREGGDAYGDIVYAGGVAGGSATDATDTADTED